MVSLPFPPYRLSCAHAGCRFPAAYINPAGAHLRPISLTRTDTATLLLILHCYCQFPSLGSRATSLSPAKMSTVTRAHLDQRLAAAKRCSREAAMAGAKAAAVATVAAAVPTLASVRMLPWAKANLNPTGQALIISTVAGMAYFIVADKTILSMARKHSFQDAPEHLKNTSFH
ncbi:uncharacterized protein LOC125519739 [Triticum urartu]|uniref:Early nodulin-93 n=3 Tax=Triticum TaxID=4564 RepID=A0A8R7QZ74_TRIUA|nr:uncharacterized protein LOC125519334 [Triticum urartu]XP_048540443.1 uncharacterized protein LOC125519739 [Triticum urartu]